MATHELQADSGLAGIFCVLGGVQLGHIQVRRATRSSIASSGPSQYGLGSGDCRLGLLQLGAWAGDKGFQTKHCVLSKMSKRFITRHNISGPNVQYDRGIRFNTKHNLGGKMEIRFLTRHVINLAKRANAQYAPFYGAINFNTPDEDDGAVQFKIGNAKSGEYVDLTNIPFQFLINMAESQASTWTLSLVDEFGQRSPMRETGAWANLMDERPFGVAGAYVDQPYGVGIQYPTQQGSVATSSDRPGATPENSQSASGLYATKVQLDVVKELFVNAKVGGRSWQFRGPGTAFSSSRDWETKSFNFNWKGQDYSLLLNKENQTMRTIRSTKFGAYKMSQVVEMILGTYGVRSDLRQILNDDFIVPFMNLSGGVPHDWVTQLLQTLCFEWKMKGGTTFTPYLPVPMGTNYPLTYNIGATTPQFIHDFTKMSVMSEEVEGSLQAMYNQVIGIRAAQGGSKTYEMEMFEFGDQYSLEFDAPLSAVTYHLDYAVAGNVYSLKYYNKAGVVVAVQNVFTGGIGYGNNVINYGTVVGAIRVEWTWGVLPGGFIGTGSPGKITFKGVEEVEGWGAPIIGSSEDMGEDNPAPMLRAFAENRALINAYGLRPIEISASSLIPSQEVLRKFCERMLYRLSRQARSATYRIPLNPFIEPGSIIREIDYTLGSLQAPLVRDRVVQACQHSFSDNPANRFTTYTGNEYVTVR